MDLQRNILTIIDVIKDLFYSLYKLIIIGFLVVVLVNHFQNSRKKIFMLKIKKLLFILLIIKLNISHTKTLFIA
jgi:hypothetical protein